MHQDTLMDPRTIHVRRETRQRQYNISDYEDLKASIKATGLIQPIVCREINGKIELMAGERRLLASIEIGLKEVPVRIMYDVTDEQAEVIELEENVKRKELYWRDNVKAVGRLHALYRAKNKKWRNEDTCAALAMHQTYFNKILKVYEALDSPRIAGADNVEQAYNTLIRFAERKAESVVSAIIAQSAAIFGTEKETPTFAFNAPVKLAAEAETSAPRTGATLPAVPATDNVVLFTPPPPPPPPKPVITDPVICANFLEWAKTYDGPRFTLIHCDFPYGNYKGDDSKKSMASDATDTDDFYDNHEEIYWNLLDCLTTNIDRLMSYSAHLMFWFNMNFYTETVQRLRKVGLMVHDHPLVWYKTEGGTGGRGVVPGNAVTYPRRIYDTALLAVRGKRPLARPGQNGYGAPTVGNKIHPSQKPEPMLRVFLSMLVDETTTMLDPTCGSGAALRAAEDLGAKSVLGLELDKNYATLANNKTLQARVMRQAGMQIRAE